MEERDKVIELLRSQKTAMLVTRGPSALEARPMQLAEVDDDGTIWFLTDERSAKASEIHAHPDVLVTCQHDRDAYVSVSGHGRLVEDRERVRALWREPFRVWFPDGIDDPSLTLIAVAPARAEYWDQRGMRALHYLFEAATAYVKGERPRVAEGEQHGRTAM